MLQYVPDPASSDFLLATGVNVESLPFSQGNLTVMSYKGDVLTGFSKRTDHEITYRVNLSPFLPPGGPLTEVLAWAKPPLLITSVLFDDTSADITVWGGSAASRYNVTVAFSAGTNREGKLDFVVKTLGDFDFFSPSISLFPPLEDVFNRIMNVDLPAYDFTPWGS